MRLTSGALALAAAALLTFTALTSVPQTDAHGAKACPTPSPSYVAPSPTIAPSTSPSTGGWTQVFQDSFSTWQPERYGIYPIGWDDTSNNGHYGYDNISSNGSVLRVHLWTNPATGKREVASFSPKFTFGGLPERYANSAIIEFRLRADIMVGYKMAPLFWPMSGVWPRDGEIDFPEGDFNGSTVTAFMHRQGATTGSDQDAFPTNAKHTDWHVYRIEWVDGVSAEFFVDGVSIGKSTNRVPNTPMRWQFQFETSLSGIVPDPSTSGYVEIDYVTMWAK